MASPSPPRGKRKGQRGPRFPSPWRQSWTLAAEAVLRVHSDHSGFSPSAVAHASGREQGVQVVGAGGRDVGHTMAWALEKELPTLGPEILCAGSSELVLVGPHASKGTPL